MYVVSELEVIVCLCAVIITFMTNVDVVISQSRLSTLPLDLLYLPNFLRSSWVRCLYRGPAFNFTTIVHNSLSISSSSMSRPYNYSALYSSLLAVSCILLIHRTVIIANTGTSLLSSSLSPSIGLIIFTIVSITSVVTIHYHNCHHIHCYTKFALVTGAHSKLWERIKA